MFPCSTGAQAAPANSGTSGFSCTLLAFAWLSGVLYEAGTFNRSREATDQHIAPSMAINS